MIAFFSGSPYTPSVRMALYREWATHGSERAGFDSSIFALIAEPTVDFVIFPFSESRPTDNFVEQSRMRIALVPETAPLAGEPPIYPRGMIEPRRTRSRRADLLALDPALGSRQILAVATFDRGQLLSAIGYDLVAYQFGSMDGRPTTRVLSRARIVPDVLSAW